jgi:hypothetical protein
MSGKNLIVLTCVQQGVLNLQPGVYSQTKTALAKADKDAVMKDLAALKILPKDVEDMVHTSCKN